VNNRRQFVARVIMFILTLIRDSYKNIKKLIKANRSEKAGRKVSDLSLYDGIRWQNCRVSLRSRLIVLQYNPIQ
jgi:hypothetical protein